MLLSTYTNAYKRVIVLSFGAASAALLLYLIFLNATDSAYELSTLTLVLLASIIFSTLGIDIYALQDEAGEGIRDHSETGGKDQ